MTTFLFSKIKGKYIQKTKIPNYNSPSGCPATGISRFNYLSISIPLSFNSIRTHQRVGPQCSEVPERPAVAAVAAEVEEVAASVISTTISINPLSIVPPVAAYRSVTPLALATIVAVLQVAPPLQPLPRRKKLSVSSPVTLWISL